MIPSRQISNLHASMQSRKIGAPVSPGLKVKGRAEFDPPTARASRTLPPVSKPPSATGPHSIPANALLTCYYESNGEGMVPVKPSLASGGYGKISVWRSIKIGKLYVRKTIAQYVEPNEIEDTVRHDLVPQVHGSAFHGRNPHYPPPQQSPSANMPEHDKDLLTTLEFWSVTFPYVAAPSLKDFFEKNAKRANEYPCPEPMIWKCAADLLAVVCEMRFGAGLVDGQEPLKSQRLIRSKHPRVNEAG